MKLFGAHLDMVIEALFISSRKLQCKPPLSLLFQNTNKYGNETKDDENKCYKE
jgi:hypothetical protein